MVYFQTSTKNDTTISSFNFVPSLEDDGKYISCVAEQAAFSGSTMESNSWRLEIYRMYI